MRRWMRIGMYLLAVAMVLVSTVGWGGTRAVAEAGATGMKPLQLVSNDGFISAGGKMSYHLIYHNVENRAVSNSLLQVRIHEAMEVFDQGEAEWDEATRLLKWNLKEVRAGGAHVVHFQLKVKTGVKLGDVFELEAELHEEGKVKWVTPKVKFVIGTETHQPFMQGYPDGTFQPEGQLTRAETAAVIARIKGLKSFDDADYEDVPNTHWAYDYIQQVTAEGYMVGYDGSFRPEDPITKAELVTLMLRLHGISNAPFETPFEDMKEHWSHHALGTAMALGYIKHLGEKEELRFAPDAAIERKVAAQWLSIGLHRGPLQDGETEVIQHFPDVPEEHAYFNWIEEASAVAHESENRGNGVEQLVRYVPEATQPF
jgi:hypothetical protein